jgi:phytoene/squalene synthetase
VAVEHYENFPVASILLPAALRAPVEVIYRFARSADDFADEGADPAATRRASRCFTTSEKSCGNMAFRSSRFATCSTPSRRT